MFRFPCLNVLLNLAEDVRIEHKMVKKQNIVHLLCGHLDRLSTPVMLMTITFLQKLCVFEENKNTMMAENAIERISHYIPCSSDRVIKVITLIF